MKRKIAILTVLAIVISLAAPLTAAFAAEDSQTEKASENEYVRLISEGFDPYALFQFSENGENENIDPDTVRWAAIRHRTAARYNEDNVEYIAQFYIYPPAEPFIPAYYNYSGEWETVIIDMTSVAALYGRETIWDSTHYTNTGAIRLDPLEPDRDAENFDDTTGRGKTNEGDYIDIAWIAFFEKEDDAKAYTGKENTPYCILDPESLSSPYMVHNLKAEYKTEKSGDDPVEIGGPSALFAFNYEDDLYDEGLFSGSKNVIEEVSFNGTCYEIIVPAGGDQNIELCFGTLADDDDIEPISAADNKIIQFAVRINPEEGGLNGNLYWQTDLYPGYSEPQNQSFRYANTSDVQIININLAKTKKWDGTVGNLRFDPFPETSVDTVVELYYVAFFENIESAEAFGEKYLAEGLSPTPAPTEKPTAAPTAAPTEAPTEVPTQAPTEAPAVTGEPATDAPAAATDKPAGSSGGISTGAVVGIVVGIVAVIAAVCAIVIVKAKKKK